MPNETGKIYKGQLWVDLKGVYTLDNLRDLISKIEGLNGLSGTPEGGSKEATEDGV